MTSQSDGDSSDDFSDEDDIDDSDIDDDALLSGDGELLLKPGKRPISGQEWVLVKRLGEDSGFGEVWLAKDEAMDTLGVFKFCNDPDNRDTIRSLHNEVDKLRSIKHDGIVRLTAANLRAKPPFLQYEYFEDSRDLQQALEEHTNQFGSLVDPEDACHVILSLAETLAYCHSSSPPLIHRDLKPANILVLDYGLLELAHAMGLPPRLSGLQFKLLDFGIATRARPERDSTQHKKSLGRAFDRWSTEEYASQQQKYGGRDYRPCPSDDIYSLGVIWWQLVTGDVPQATDSPEDLQSRLDDVHLPATLKTILRGCLASSAKTRIPNATKLVELLGGSLSERRPHIGVSLKKEVDWDYDTLELDHVRRLSRKCAEFIANQFKGVLRLNRLEHLSVEVAKELAGRLEAISLNGLKHLSVEVANALSESTSLSLDGLHELRLDVAEALLSGHSIQPISLNGLDHISPEVLRTLIERCGDADAYYLNGLKNCNVETARLLACASLRSDDERQIECHRVADITLDAAKALADVQYKLELDLGLKGLSPEIARAFAGSRNLSLTLDSVDKLSEETWKILASEYHADEDGRTIKVAPAEITPEVIQALNAAEQAAPEGLSPVLVVSLHRLTNITADVAKALQEWDSYLWIGTLELQSVGLDDLNVGVVKELSGYRGNLRLKNFADKAANLPKVVQDLLTKASHGTSATTPRSTTMTCTLDICGDKKIQSPTEADIRQAVCAHDIDQNNSFFLSIDRSDMTYMQTVEVQKSFFLLEYRDTAFEHNYRASRILTADEVVKALVLYSAGSDEWKRMAEWKVAPDYWEG